MRKSLQPSDHRVIEENKNNVETKLIKVEPVASNVVILDSGISARNLPPSPVFILRPSPLTRQHRSGDKNINVHTV